jgi:hypothetical protein
MASWNKEIFQVHDYSRNMKARVAIFNMNGRASIWWEDLKKVKKISERKITWKNLRNTFRQNTFQRDTMMVRSKNFMK